MAGRGNKGAKPPRAALAYPGAYYAPYMLQDAKVISPEAQRVELARLLDIARKRQSRLRSSEFSGSYAATRQLPKLRDIPKAGTPGANRAIADALADVALFIKARTSTVGGAREYREDITESLQTTFGQGEPGDEFVNFENFNERDWSNFGAYMWALKRAGRTKEGEDSMRAVRTYFMVRQLGGTVKAARDYYETWASNTDVLMGALRDEDFSRRRMSASSLAGALGIDL